MFQVDGLVQERRNSIANALELRLSRTNPSKLPLMCVQHEGWLEMIGRAKMKICSNEGCGVTQMLANCSAKFQVIHAGRAVIKIMATLTLSTNLHLFQI